jgi:magnesium-transporting ATPase (P-type)
MALPAEERHADIPGERPLWVWIITIFYAISILFAAFSLYLVLSGKMPGSPIQHAYFAGLTPLDNIVTALIGVCNVGGAISLFLLRKMALPFFITAFGLNVALTIWQISYRNLLAVSGVVPLGLGLLVSLAIILYAANLSKRRILS